MQIIETDDAGIRSAALEIIRSHRPEHIEFILQTAEPRVARAIAALLARHGLQRRAQSGIGANK